jgi:hypothetical protein
LAAFVATAIDAKPIDADALLVKHLDLADDIEIRPVGLENKEIAHGN